MDGKAGCYFLVKFPRRGYQLTRPGVRNRYLLTENITRGALVDQVRILTLLFIPCADARILLLDQLHAPSWSK